MSPLKHKKEKENRQVKQIVCLGFKTLIYTVFLYPIEVMETIFPISVK